MRRHIVGTALLLFALLSSADVACAASIRREIVVEASAEAVWDAVRDFAAVHQRLVPGFVVDTRMDGDARIVTFANGTTARELLVDSDDATRRLVYAVVGGRVVNHSAAVQVFADGARRSRIVWITDVLPNELAGYIASQMDAAVIVMKKTLEHPAQP
jgi:carbon monoxide dehydrogenase subunit G